MRLLVSSSSSPSGKQEIKGCRGGRTRYERGNCSRGAEVREVDSLSVVAFRVYSTRKSISFTMTIIFLLTVIIISYILKDNRKHKDRRNM